MMLRPLFKLILVLFLQSGLAGATCPEPFDPFLTQILLKQIAIKQPVLDSQILSTTLERLSRDPDLPDELKLILHETITHEGVTIGELTDALRKEHHIENAFGQGAASGYAYHSTQTLQIEGSNKQFHPFPLRPDTLDQNGKRMIRNHTALVDVGLSPLVHDPALVLIHELSHVKFYGRLDIEFQALAREGRIPPWAFVKTPDGHFWIEAEFLTYFNERYAYEMEYKMWKAGGTRYFHPELRQFLRMGITANMTTEEANKKIADFVFSSYKITERRLLEFNAIPIKQVLPLGI